MRDKMGMQQPIYSDVRIKRDKFEKNVSFLHKFILQDSNSQNDSTSISSNEQTPPKIITSTLNKVKGVVKPIAFKPLTPPRLLSSAQREANHCRYGSTPTLARYNAHFPHYASSSDLLKSGASASVVCTAAPSERKLRSASPMAMSSLPFSVNRKLHGGYESMDNVRCATATSFKEYNAFSKSLQRMNDLSTSSDSPASLLDDLTPSPCDSGAFVELESAIKERDYELSYLRQTMERNEQVIFKVYQEKEQAYQRELKKMKSVHENRLRVAAQKSLKLEQMLMMQNYQQQEEKKRLREENVKLSGEILTLRADIDALKLRLEETEWNLCEKVGELAHIKSQLKDSQGEQNSKGFEVLSLKNEISELKINFREKMDEIESLKHQIKDVDREDQIIAEDLQSLLNHLDEEVSSSDSDDFQKVDDTNKPKSLVQRLRRTIQKVMKEWKSEKSFWQEERDTWIAEKEKVICYQKQLQRNYVEMFRTNQSLESALRSLSIEMDRGGDKPENKITENFSVQL